MRRKKRINGYFRMSLQRTFHSKYPHLGRIGYVALICSQGIVRRQSTVSMILFILKSETIPYIKYFILYVNLLLLTKIYVKNHFFFLLFYLFYFIILCINKIKIIYSQI